MSFHGLLSKIWPFSQQVYVDDLDYLIKDAQAEPWHRYAIKKRYTRFHVCKACSWLSDVLKKEDSIFEPGCGSGINLLWLGQRNFTNLYGSDLSEKAIRLSHLLSKQLDIKIDTWVDDGLGPQKMPDKLMGIVSVNWLYHIEGASLERFFELYKPYVAPNGYMAFDIVDKSYNNIPNSKYHTKDISLPEDKRRPSEYKFRLSPDEVEKIIKKYGFKLIKSSRPHGHIPRTVWLVQGLS